MISGWKYGVYAIYVTGIDTDSDKQERVEAAFGTDYIMWDTKISLYVAQGDAYDYYIGESDEGRLDIVFNDVLDNVEEFVPEEEETPQELKDTSNVIYSIVLNIGVVLSVLIIAALGIKYMVGSLEEKAEYKETMLIYFIGAILLFSVTVIANILYNIGQGLNN